MKIEKKNQVTKQKYKAPLWKQAFCQEKRDFRLCEGKKDNAYLHYVCPSAWFIEDKCKSGKRGIGIIKAGN